MRRLPSATALLLFVSAGCGMLGGCGIALDGYAGPALTDAAPNEDAMNSPVDAAEADAPSTDATLLDASDEDAEPSGPITFVQTNASNTGSANTTSFTVAFNAAVADHNTLIAAILVSPQTASLTSVTDTLGNSFQILCNQQFPADDEFVYLAAAFDVAGGAIDAITVHTTQSSTTNLVIHEYANIASLGDCTNTVGTATTVDGIVSPPLTVTVPNELLFAYATGSIIGPGTGFTARSTFDQDVTEDRIATDPGMDMAFASVTNNVPNWAIVAAAFVPR